MGKHCCYGTCRSDSRYKERLGDVFFIPFPKPRNDKPKCLRWIEACGRPEEQFNTSRINKDTYICSLHFVGGKGPTTSNPDPVPPEESELPNHMPSSAKKRTRGNKKNGRRKKLRTEECFEEDEQESHATLKKGNTTKSTNTEMHPLQILSMTASLMHCKEIPAASKADDDNLKEHCQNLQLAVRKLSLDKSLLQQRCDQLDNDFKNLQKRVTLQELASAELRRDLLQWKQRSRIRSFSA